MQLPCVCRESVQRGWWRNESGPGACPRALCLQPSPAGGHCHALTMKHHDAAASNLGHQDVTSRFWGVKRCNAAGWVHHGPPDFHGPHRALHRGAPPAPNLPAPNLPRSAAATDLRATPGLSPAVAWRSVPLHAPRCENNDRTMSNEISSNNAVGTVADLSIQMER